MGSLSTMHNRLRDTRLLNRLRSKIAATGRIPRLDVDVDVENGVVELLGVIADDREHAILGSLIER
jgi:osmotically-inducible protein OsmY